MKSRNRVSNKILIYEILKDLGVIVHSGPHVSAIYNTYHPIYKINIVEFNQSDIELVSLSIIPEEDPLSDEKVKIPGFKLLVYPDSSEEELVILCEMLARVLSAYGKR